jgi:hypothetical protein
MQTSAMTTRSGRADLMARMACCTIPSSEKFSLPTASLTAGTPKSMSDGIASPAASRASATAWSTESWATPGMDVMARRTPSP